MYKEHPAFTKPQGNKIKIWRYMDFTKFVSLLGKEQLFFARADKLGDPFEGSYPKENVQQRAIAYKKMMGQLPSYLQESFRGRGEASNQFFKNLKNFIFINSWHESRQESAALWKLYLKSNEGVAIQSTFGRLKGCFKQGTPDIYIGEVHYIDYQTEKISESNFFNSFLHKRRSFEYEKEIRALVLEYTRQRAEVLEYARRKDEGVHTPSKPPSSVAAGVPVDVDLEELIANIYVAPENPKWFVELVKSVTRKYGLNKPVVQSTLDAKPLY
jgi:hypothetical protein